MKEIKDYLEYNNNNDIGPFIKSMEYMREFFKKNIIQICLKMVYQYYDYL